MLFPQSASGLLPGSSSEGSIRSEHSTTFGPLLEDCHFCLRHNVTVLPHAAAPSDSCPGAPFRWILGLDTVEASAFQ